VMDTFAYPRGLIRYATQRSLDEGGVPLTLGRVLRPRVLMYSAVLLLISGAFVASLAERSPVRVDVVRDRGALARLAEDGGIENVYRLQVMNATEAVQRYRFAVTGIPGAKLKTRGEAVLAPAESRWVSVTVEISPEQARALGPGVHNLVFRITREPDAGAPEVTVDEKSTLVVPR
jgi:polyferredoxin